MMNPTLDLSQDWELGWCPEPHLNTWCRRIGRWWVEGGQLQGRTREWGQILVNIEPEGDHAVEGRFTLLEPSGSAYLMLRYQPQRGAYYQVLTEPGKPVQVNYICNDAFDAVLLPPTGPALSAGREYQFRAVLEGGVIRIFLDGDGLGEFPDDRLVGARPGFGLANTHVAYRDVRVTALPGAALLFQDDFSQDSLRRMEPVELADLQPERWIPAAIPGTVHSALLDAGLIEDPYIGCNGPKQKWIDNQRWIYRKRFTVPDKWKAKDLELVFEGIDYHGFIWLNGVLLGYHEGMFNGPEFDISCLVRREGSNELVVCLLPCPHPAHSNVKPYILQRWHFNMDILTVGLWRPVKLRTKERVRLLRPQVTTLSIGEEKAVLDVRVDVSSYAMWPFEMKGAILVESPDPADPPLAKEFRLGYFNGTQRVKQVLEVPSPKLWWPNGLGGQPLYRIRIQLEVKEPLLGPEPTGQDELSLTFGIRTLRMLPTPDQQGKYNWVFAINDRPFFGKGSNWMPVDQMLRLTPERYRNLLELARDSNINILRPWGAGLLETDEFYDLCDRFGICVWQEFLLANGSYDEFDRSVWRETIIRNVTRLRNHPSLVLWCGGNEFDPDSEANRDVVDELENLCREHDPSRDFHRASPYGGDSHSYQVNWMEGADYSYFTRDLSAAVTEFSMSSATSMVSLRKILPAQDFESWPPDDPSPLEEYGLEGWTPDKRRRESAFSMHDAHLYPGLKAQMPFISEYGLPNGWNELIEYSQAGQGMLTRFGIDCWRSRWPYCTATMSWVFNVIWPSAMTWEYVDWFGVPKISYYDQKRAYEPLHVGAVFEQLFNEPGSLFRAKLFVHNETLVALRDGSVVVRLYDNRLKLLATDARSISVAVDENKHAGFFTWPIPKDMEDKFLCLCVDLMGPDKRLLSRSIYHPRVGPRPANDRMPYLKNGPWICELKQIKTDLEAEWAEPWTEEGEGWLRGRVCVRNSGARPAYMVSLTAPGFEDRARFEDNYFWLEPGESQTVKVAVQAVSCDLTINAWNAHEAICLTMKGD